MRLHHIKSEKGTGTIMNFIIDTEQTEEITPDEPKTIVFPGVVEPAEINVEIDNSCVDYNDNSILIVEDNVTIRRMMNRMFSKLSIKGTPFDGDNRVDLSTDGLEALDKLKSNKYELVFMDINMPNMSGDKATRLFREWEKEHRLGNKQFVCALTGDANSEDMKEIGKLFDKWITKPITPDNVKKIIKHRYVN